MGCCFSTDKENGNEDYNTQPSIANETTPLVPNSVYSSKKHEEECEDLHFSLIHDIEYIANFDPNGDQVQQIAKLKEFVSQGFMTVEEYKEERDIILNLTSLKPQVDSTIQPDVVTIDTSEVNEVEEEQQQNDNSNSLQEQLVQQKQTLKKATPIEQAPPTNTADDSGVPTRDQIVRTKTTLKKVETKKADPWKNVF
jgi:hypothetical protein